MAATRAKKRVAGVLPEDQNKNPSNLQKELAKIYQKNKQRKVEPVRKGRALEQSEPPPNMTSAVEELPFADVQPLPVVARSQPKTKVDVVADSVEVILDNPKLMVEPGFKNKAPLQQDGRAKGLLEEALENPISITTKDLLSISEPMRQELKKLLIKKRLEKKSVALAAEVDPGDVKGTSSQRQVEMISVERLPEATVSKYLTTW